MNAPRAYWTMASGQRCAFFKGDEPVRLCVGPVEGDAVELVIAARHPRGLWSPWQTVQRCRATAVGGEFVVSWSLADDRWAFADFRFDATIRDGGRTRRVRSGTVRHYAATVGFYGFGPVGERWSNAEVRRVAREVGGVAIGARDPVALRRLASCIPPQEQNMRLYGYSLGGRAAVRLARWLARRGVGVELLVGIDPVDLAAKTLAVPPNVRRAVSFYQRNGARIFLLPGPAGRGLAFTAVEARTAVENHRLETWRVDERSLPVMHEDMPRAVRAELTRLLSEGGQW